MIGKRFEFVDCILQDLVLSKIFRCSGDLWAIDLSFKARGDAGRYALYIAGELSKLDQRCAQALGGLQMLGQRLTIRI